VSQRDTFIALSVPTSFNILVKPVYIMAIDQRPHLFTSNLSIREAIVIARNYILTVGYFLWRVKFIGF